MTTVIAVSAGGATIVIGLVIVLVLLTALLVKVKSKHNGESTSRTGIYDILWLFALVWTLIYNIYNYLVYFHQKMVAVISHVQCITIPSQNSSRNLFMNAS